jgi:hypothetical protein
VGQFQASPLVAVVQFAKKLAREPFWRSKLWGLRQEIDYDSIIRMVAFLKFWYTAIRETLVFGWVVFGAMSTLLPAVISLIQKHSPTVAAIPLIKWVAENQVEIQVSIAALFLVPYLLYAPYRLYKEQGKELAALSVKSNEIVEKLAEFLVEGEHWKDICCHHKLQIFPGDQINLWATKLDTYLTSKLGNSYAVRVKSASGLPTVLAANLAPGVPQAAWRAIHIRCVRLNQFMEELSSQPKSPINSSSDQT